MRNKKGEEILTKIIFDAVIALMFIVVGILIWKAVAGVLPKQEAYYTCSNGAMWESTRGLRDTLDQLDSGEVTTAEFLSYNKNCKLVSYSLVQSRIPEIEYPRIQPREPMLCLCDIDNSYLKRQKVCKPYDDCFRFKNFDQINTEQFSTEDLKDYVLLRFTKNGKILNIESITSQKDPEPITYTKQEADNPLDSTGLINKMIIVFDTNKIKSFNPIVKQKITELIIPEAIPNIQGFTNFFNIDLALPPLQGQSQQDYFNNPDVIAPNRVKRAFLQISIPKDKLTLLTEFQKNNLALYYKKEMIWKITPLNCLETDKEFLCNARLNDFSNEFAISTLRLVDAFTSDSEKEASLSLYIQEQSIKNDIDPLFIKSIIKIETNWETKSVGPCGEAGLTQFMPHTAKGFGLNIKEEVNGISIAETDSCNPNKPYATALKTLVDQTPEEQLATLDDRFDDRKAISAAIQYFVRIKNGLSNKGIPVTKENMAAAYNGGLGGVNGDNNYKNQGMQVYAQKLASTYNNLRQSTFYTGVDKVWPVDDPFITSCYGSRNINLYGEQRGDWHDGIDFGISEGTNIKAVAEGTIQSICDGDKNYKDPDYSGKCHGSGNRIIISHSDGTYTEYNHLSQILVTQGSSVIMGQVIAKSGNTGVSTGPHLDFKVFYTPDFSPDIEKPSYRRDPIKYLPPLNSYKLSTGSKNCLDSPTLIALKSQGVNIQLT